MNRTVLSLLSHGRRSIRRCFGSETSNYIKNFTPQQIEVIEARDMALRNSYLELEKNLSPEERDSVRRKRMIYRSKQRGWLEADILLGSWASEFVPTLTETELDEYDVILKEETIDIYNFVSGKDPLPLHLQNLSVMKKLQDYALNKDIIGPSAYEIIKKRANLT